MAEDAATNDQAAHLVLKVPLKHLISNKLHRKCIEDATRQLQRVGDVALAFGKFEFLSRLDQLIDDAAGGFDASVAAQLTKEFPFSSPQIEEWLDVASTSLSKRRGPPYTAERAARMKELHDRYASLAASGHVPAAKADLSNLSVSKGALAQQLEVNFAVNVHCHFDKYVWRFVKHHLAVMTKQENGVASEDELPAHLKAQLNLDVRAVVSDILQSRRPSSLTCRPELRAWVCEWMPKLVPPRPAGSNPHWRFLSQKSNPKRWIPYMVMINRWLEEEDQKLFSPIPQRTSFIPAHIHLDANSLVDLLVRTQDDAYLLKAGVEAIRMPALHAKQLGNVPPTWSLPGLLHKNKKTGAETISKAGFYDAVTEIVDPNLLARVNADPPLHTAELGTAVWSSLTKLGGNKHVPKTYRGLVFSNAVDTDGISASLHYVRADLRGLTRFNGGFARLQDSRRQQVEMEKSAGSTYTLSLIFVGHPRVNHLVPPFFGSGPPPWRGEGRWRITG